MGILAERPALVALSVVTIGAIARYFVFWDMFLPDEIVENIRDIDAERYVPRTSGLAVLDNGLGLKADVELTIADIDTMLTKIDALQVNVAGAEAILERNKDSMTSIQTYEDALRARRADLVGVLERPGDISRDGYEKYKSNIRDLQMDIAKEARWLQ